MAVKPTYDMAKLRLFANRLRQARIDAGCETMEEGARRCHTRSSVYHRHESGIIMATVFMIDRYARAFGCSPGWLAFGERAKPVAAPPIRKRFHPVWDDHRGKAKRP